MALTLVKGVFLSFRYDDVYDDGVVMTMVMDMVVYIMLV
jgi:hypothetical protein